MKPENFLSLGIIGDKRVAHSLSPRMHNAIMKRRGITGAYVPFPVESAVVGSAVAGIRALGINGVNVTVPHKKAVMDHLDQLSDTAQRAGAVNTILRRNKTLEGHNTDVGGFIDALEQTGFDVAGKTALVAGAGGAARAVLLALQALEPKRVILTGRDQNKVEPLAKEMLAVPLPWTELTHAAGEAGLIVNATAVSSPDESPELAALVGKMEAGPRGLIFDLNYGRRENFWQDLAQRRGSIFLDGLPMLANQARRSFAIWTGIEAPVEEFFQALTETT
ncbi:MAG: shikimate dehydrogenase [Thermodesulfobacteriota bacterium]|nr:shikimate dehydrogenase [Thermodesulfobacteriota bacterium]